MFTKQCPRCGINLRPDQRIHWACVRARAYQVGRVPLLTTLVLVAIVLGALVTNDASPAQSTSTAAAPPPTVTATIEPTITMTPAPTATPAFPAVVAVNVAAAQLYEEPGSVGDIVLTRGDVLQVQGAVDVDGVTWFAVVSDGFGGQRWIMADDVEALPD